MAADRDVVDDCSRAVHPSPLAVEREDCSIFDHVFSTNPKSISDNQKYHQL
jgi:hypothetical protein